MTEQPHEFDFALDVGADLDTYLDEIAEMLIDAGCADTTFSVRNGVAHAEFTRFGADLSEAVISALEDVRKVEGIDVLRVDFEQLVTASEIARRLGRSRQSVQQLIAGTRGPGNFPDPADWVQGARLWSWPAVEQWMAEKSTGVEATAASDAEFVAALNGALQMRHHLVRLDEPAQREAVASVLNAK